jgi:hypothetical protein
MVINLASLPQETIEKYDLNELAQDGKVYIEIQKCMYALPQAGILANELLQRNLAKDGYRPTTHTHGLWTHDTRPISFSLVVDDFGVKYVGQEHAEHLMTCIEKKIQHFKRLEWHSILWFNFGLELQKPSVSCWIVGTASTNCLRLSLGCVSEFYRRSAHFSQVAPVTYVTNIER